MRLRTTHKDVNTPALQSAAEDFRVTNKHIWSKYKDIKIWNMDETAVYLDAPGNRTIDLIGAHTVEIATTKHEKDRVTVVLCVSSDGERKPPLLILRSKNESQWNTINHTEVRYNNGQQSMEMYVAYNEKAYMNSKLMCEWIRHVFKPAVPPNTTIPVSADGYESVLLLDNVKSHTRPVVLLCFTDNKVNAIHLPPNCTPLVQPLDHSLNATFKRVYEEQWRIWYHNVSHTKLTPKGNRQKVDNDTIKTWIAAAVAGSLTPEHIIRCFAHTLNGEKVMEEAERGYKERQTALAAQNVLATASSAREAVDSALESVLNMWNPISITAGQQQHTAAVDDDDEKDEE
jgi:hypothetical protein